MKTVIISYSFTGNNESLANSVAKELGAEQIKVKNIKKRTMWTCAFDVLFKRTPKVEPKPEILDKYALVIFCGPVWMGQVAAPFRQYFKYLKNKKIKYGFITICGGATGQNEKINEQLEKLTGTKPLFVSQQCISDLLPEGKKPVIKDTIDYVVTDTDIKKITPKVVKDIKEFCVNNK